MKDVVPFDPKYRPDDVAFVNMACKISGKDIDPRITLPDFHCDFALRLPQTSYEGTGKETTTNTHLVSMLDN